MHVLVDAVAVRSGSAAIVVEHLLRGWVSASQADRITVLAGPDGPAFAPPPGAEVRTVHPPVPGPVGALWLRSIAVRRAARVLDVDVVLSGVPASGLLGTKCPRGVILYDLRHEIRPEQFSRGQRLARRLSWWWSWRRADHVFTISERTLDDFRVRHPGLAHRAVAAPLGSDHVSAWPAAESGGAPYALAFGHFANKNARAVLEGWAEFCRSDERWQLRLIGMGDGDRRSAEALVDALGIADRVEVMPWLDDHAFQALFVSASMVVFPSDFEGFGLPAAEAQRLGIPVVVSADPALAEVTGGHAAVAAAADPDHLADAMRRAAAAAPTQIEDGRRHAEGFTWARTAGTVRAAYSSSNSHDR